MRGITEQATYVGGINAESAFAWANVALFPDNAISNENLLQCGKWCVCRTGVPYDAGLAGRRAGNRICCPAGIFESVQVLGNRATRGLREMV